MDLLAQSPSTVLPKTWSSCHRNTPLLVPMCLNQGFYSCTNSMTKKQVGEERVYSAYTSTLLFITEGSQELMLRPWRDVLYWLPWWWTAVWKCKPNKPFPHHLLLGHDVCAGIETLTKARWYQEWGIPVTTWPCFEEDCGRTLELFARRVNGMWRALWDVA